MPFKQLLFEELSRNKWSHNFLGKVDNYGDRLGPNANPKHRYLTTWRWDSTFNYLSPEFSSSPLIESLQCTFIHNMEIKEKYYFQWRGRMWTVCLYSPQAIWDKIWKSWSVQSYSYSDHFVGQALKARCCDDKMCELFFYFILFSLIQLLIRCIWSFKDCVYTRGH